MTSGHASMHTGGDLDWALGMYGLFARGGDDESMSYLTVEGNPWSKARPKFARRGKGVTTYQPDADRAAEARLRDTLRELRREPFPGNVMIACRFYRADFQRIDTDNLLKHVCDSANGVLWADDSQVTLVLGEVLHDPDRPRTIILAGNHGSSLLRGDDRMRPCVHCEAMYLPVAGARASVQRFCSAACSYAARTTVLVPVPCPVCGKEFRPRTKKQLLCSRECVTTKLRGRRKPERAPSSCLTCGKQLAHNRGGRCRDCWRADPRFYPEEQLALEEVATR